MTKKSTQELPSPRLPRSLADNPFDKLPEIPTLIGSFGKNSHKTESEEDEENSVLNGDIYKQRRRVATAIVALALTPFLVRAWNQSNHYGYHPHKTPVENSNPR